MRNRKILKSKNFIVPLDVTSTTKEEVPVSATVVSTATTINYIPLTLSTTTTSVSTKTFTTTVTTGTARTSARALCLRTQATSTPAAVRHDTGDAPSYSLVIA